MLMGTEENLTMKSRFSVDAFVEILIFSWIVMWERFEVIM
jgi:hypothetical protein